MKLYLQYHFQGSSKKVHVSDTDEISGKLQHVFLLRDHDRPEELRGIDVSQLPQCHWSTVAFAALEWAKAPHSEPVNAGHYLAFHPDVDLRGAEIRIRVGEKSFRDIGTLTLEE